MRNTMATGPGSSPHTRGAQPGREAGALGEGIIPAYAGSTYLLASRAPVNPDHPRIRGEHVATVGLERKVSGSSPHTRGAPGLPGDAHDGFRIIPAYAGSTTPSTHL